MGNGWYDVDPQRTRFFFTFGAYYVYANFGENRSRNTTVRLRVLADGCTDTLTDRRKPIL